VEKLHIPFVNATIEVIQLASPIVFTGTSDKLNSHSFKLYKSNNEISVDLNVFYGIYDKIELGPLTALKIKSKDPNFKINSMLYNPTSKYTYVYVTNFKTINITTTAFYLKPEPGIIVYQSCNATGNMISLHNGKYEVKDLKMKNTPNTSNTTNIPTTTNAQTLDPKISTIMILPFTSVHLFNESEFKGAKITLHNNSANVLMYDLCNVYLDWNDNTSSLIVEGIKTHHVIIEKIYAKCYLDPIDNLFYDLITLSKCNTKNNYTPTPTTNKTSHYVLPVTTTPSILQSGITTTSPDDTQIILQCKIQKPSMVETFTQHSSSNVNVVHNNPKNQGRANTIQLNPTQARPTQPRPIQPGPTQPRPTQARPTQPRPTQPSPMQPRPTQPRPTQPRPTQPRPTQPRPTQPRPIQPSPTQPRPTQPRPTQPRPTQPSPTQPRPTQPRPTQPRPTQPRPTQPISIQPVLARATLAPVPTQPRSVQPVLARATLAPVPIQPRSIQPVPARATLAPVPTQPRSVQPVPTRATLAPVPTQPSSVQPIPTHATLASVSTPIHTTLAPISTPIHATLASASTPMHATLTSLTSLPSVTNMTNVPNIPTMVSTTSLPSIPIITNAPTITETQEISTVQPIQPIQQIQTIQQIQPIQIEPVVIQYLPAPYINLQQNDIIKVTNKITNINDINKINIGCETNPLVYLELKNDEYGNYYYQYACDTNKNFNYPYYLYGTDVTDFNNINDLTLHEVDCKGNPITMIEHDFSNGQFKYNYACSNNNLTDLTNYQTNVKITNDNDFGNILGEPLYCEDNSYLTKFKLNIAQDQNTNEYMYYYTYQCGKLQEYFDSQNPFWHNDKTFVISLMDNNKGNIIHQAFSSGKYKYKTLPNHKMIELRGHKIKVTFQNENGENVKTYTLYHNKPIIIESIPYTQFIVEDINNIEQSDNNDVIWIIILIIFMALIGYYFIEKK
jgi:hypothetical protein